MRGQFKQRGRGRNKFENLCPIPLKKDSIKYVQTKPNQQSFTVAVFIVSIERERKRERERESK